MIKDRLICPVCGRKLPYDGNSRENSRGERVRFRRCGCGYSRTEHVTVRITEFFPESARPPGFQPPGEGGYGFAKQEGG